MNTTKFSIRRMIPVLAAIVLTGLMLQGCGQDEVKQVNPSQAAQTILEQVEFQDELLKAEGAVVDNYYFMDDAVSDFAVYISGTGATAEEVAVLRVSDPGDLPKAVAVLEKRLESQKKRYVDYVPGEMLKLENPVLVSKGTTAVLVVADDAGAARKVVDDLL